MKDQRQSSPRIGLIVSVGTIVVASAFAGYQWGVSAAFPTLAERGLFGDSFGALNALFSGVALVGVVIAIWYNAVQLRHGQRSLLADHERRRKETTLQALFAIRPKLKAYSRFLNNHAGAREAISRAMMVRLKDDPALASELQDHLEDIETFAMAVNVGVYDEDLTLQVSGPLLAVLWMRSKPYIDYYRINYPSVANHFQELAEKAERLKAHAYRPKPMEHDPTLAP